MYKNIIFDLGGVVVDFDPREFLVDHFMNERVEDQLYDITSVSYTHLDTTDVKDFGAEPQMSSARFCSR